MPDRTSKVRSFRREKNVIIGSSSGKSQKEQEEEPMKDWESLSHVRWECKYHLKIFGNVLDLRTDGIRK